MPFGQFEQPPKGAEKKEEPMRVAKGEVFENPEGYWEHKGAFSVELTLEAPKDNLPKGALVKGSSILVESGRIKQVMGGIQFYADDQPFAWGYKCIVAIRDGGGNLLWVNDDYRSKVLGGTEKKSSSYYSAGGPRSRIEQSKRKSRK